ncbi:cellulose synthase/poly-beta-1,6-N-acetylglucosamine synthase-like glycosyltransferase [Streptomyces sp. SLBN-118]|uniref:glycosyltransferase family 2 protein n=1 Tax=Streptomyces sp. SLBN-118 TaxID=2768454 RepID=UPI00116CE592|nr:glycosyltransferase family 2 protein [Streptomyces sp. SLBN-118]TQK44076.1 cellulose synthase/poly-beta-1,6-N-acetylglucosamine synthase-like glycosyltransferase [Streptomyces sp. SLBN-118]
MSVGSAADILSPVNATGAWSLASDESSGWLIDAARTLIAVSDGAILTYFALINTSYLLLILLAVGELVRRLRRAPFAGYDDTSASPFTPPVSLIMPAYNEEAGIAEAVRAMLLLRYPVFEVVVVDDGSSDGTLDALRGAFGLVEVDRVVPDDVQVRGAVESVHLPRGGPVPLVVARKANGGKADALNAGINLARYPLLCMVDADSILDSESLLAVAKPFCDDPMRVVATGGVVGIANGCTVVAGRVVEPRVPQELLGRIQVVEYLRAFMLGRTGWSKIGGLLVIAGAFGLFRRDVVVAVGGMDANCIGEDAELVVRMHRYLRDQGRDYRIVFVSEPISWSEAPSTAKILGKQRRRWHRGLTELLLKHRRMIGNPRYGRIGLVSLPFYVVFELLAPVVELAGLVLVPVGLLVGAVDPDFLWRFLLVAYGYALVVSLVSLAVEEYAFHRFARSRDIWGAVVGAIAENLGYRQLTAWWRLRGMWDALRGAPQVWGSMTRSGFTESDEARASEGDRA